MSPNWQDKLSFGRAWDPRMVCAISLALVFLCGAATGAVVMSYGGLHTRLHQPGFDTAAGKALYYARIQKELDLTPTQTEQMQSILNDLWLYYRMVISDSKVRVEQVLNDEQRKKFERILQEHQPR
jgi:hypothetical protein